MIHDYGHVYLVCFGRDVGTTLRSVWIHRTTWPPDQICNGSQRGEVVALLRYTKQQMVKCMLSMKGGLHEHWGKDRWVRAALYVFEQLRTGWSGSFFHMKGLAKRSEDQWQVHVQGRGVSQAMRTLGCATKRTGFLFHSSAATMQLHGTWPQKNASCTLTSWTIPCL